jgi:hypothetical protein
MIGGGLELDGIQAGAGVGVGIDDGLAQALDRHDRQEGGRRRRRGGILIVAGRHGKDGGRRQAVFQQL